MDSALGGPIGSERLSKDERFFFDDGLWGVSPHSTQSANRGVKDHIKTIYSKLEVFRPCCYCKDSF